MTSANQFLEKAKMEELTANLQAQGYSIAQEDRDYDIIATDKNGKVIAIEVKARSNLQEFAEQISTLREIALQRGYDEFRLVVVNPPQERNVEIDDLEGILFSYFMNEATPQKLDELSSHTIVTGISDVDVTSIKVTSNEIEIQGTGSVEVDLEWSGGSSRDGLNIDTSFPLQFNIVLNKDLEIEEVREMEIDTSLFFE